MPTAVTFAGMYVNSLLMLRTNKGMTDHAISAAMDQDCGLMNIFEHGSYCTDAPAPQLLAAMSADADMLGAKSGVASPENATAVSPPAGTGGEAAATRTVVSPSARAAGGPAGAENGYLVILASYRNPDIAAAHKVRLGSANSLIVKVDVNGEAYHRVALRADSQSAAQRTLALAKASGAVGAWMSGRASQQIAPRHASPKSPEPPRRLPTAPSYAEAPVAPPLL